MQREHANRGGGTREATLQLPPARRIRERWGWLLTFVCENGSGMYIVKKSYLYVHVYTCIYLCGVDVNRCI